MPHDQSPAIAWNSRPAKTDYGIKFRIVRTPETGGIAGVSLAKDLEGCYTHYFGGRTQPCSGTTCEACEAKLRPRWLGWLPLFGPQSKEIIIFEFTANCVPAIDTWRERGNSLRGAKVMVNRITRKANGRLSMKIEKSIFGENELPPCPNVRETLLKIWGVWEEPLFKTGEKTPRRLKPRPDGTAASRRAANPPGLSIGEIISNRLENGHVA